MYPYMPLKPAFSLIPSFSTSSKQFQHQHGSYIDHTFSKYCRGTPICNCNKISTMAVIAKHLKSTVTLNDGVVMPMFGLGTYKLSTGEGGEAETITSFALKYGYRLIDTAAFYGNEEGVGRGIALSGVPREEVFVVTKLWNDMHGKEKCKKSFKESLRKLNTGYVDLYLMHSPLGGDILKTYDAMLELKAAGLIRSVGVSNFGVQHLEGLRLAGRPAPSTNQFELHPFQRKSDLVDYCRKHDIAVMGYSPLAKAKKMSDEKVNELARKNGRTGAQFMIRWSVQQGYITIPKSSLIERIKENADVFDWTISPEDLEELDKLETFKCTWDPTTSSWADLA